MRVIALGNSKPFPETGLKYGEAKNGWYLAIEKSGDFVAFHVTNCMGLPNEPNAHPLDHVLIVDHTWNDIDTDCFVEYMPIKQVLAE